VRFEDIQYHAIVQNPGSKFAFTAFATSIRYAVVKPNSSAVVEVRQLGPARFASPVSKDHWRAAGSPVFPYLRARTTVDVYRAGQFSFLPQGATLNYRGARAMPSQAAAVLGTVRGYILPYFGPQPPSELVLRQLGFLLASAPLTRQARAAIWLAVERLPGVRLCGVGTDFLGRHGNGICARVANERIEILFKPVVGEVLAVEQWLLRPTPLFPTIPGGSLVESDTFRALSDH